VTDTRGRAEYAYNRFFTALNELRCVQRMVEDGSTDKDLRKRAQAALVALKDAKSQLTGYLDRLEKEAVEATNK
jgi:hypothetical protein